VGKPRSDMDPAELARARSAANARARAWRAAKNGHDFCKNIRRRHRRMTAAVADMGFYGYLRLRVST
jgi:hypothetical protein